MKRFLAFGGVLCLLVLVLGLLRARADDQVAGRMRALFPRFDADRNRVLSPAEQTGAVAFVASQYGAGWSARIRRMFASSAGPEGGVAEERWEQAVADYSRRDPPQKQVFRIAMRDGVELATDVYRPSGSGPFPVILTRTPYHRAGGGQTNTAAGLVRQGYAYVVQDMRGRFESGGENLPFVGCGWGEHQDGVDTLAWLRRQPWCNGKIGTLGGSASGITQNLLAGATTNGPTAQYIHVAAASMYHDAAYVGGALRKSDVEKWTTDNRFDPKALQIMRDHPDYDDYWRTLDTSLKFAAMNAPAVHVGGWFDMFAQATIDQFAGRQHQGAEGARGRQKLVMGPWDHGGARKEGVGELEFPDNRPPAAYDATVWFEHHLFGEDNGVAKQPAVAYYVMGDTSVRGAPGNEWRYADDWPVPATDTPFYFGRDGTLATTRSDTADSFVEYVFDPANPCPTVGGNNLTLARGPMNQNRIEDRRDVVLFTSEPLAAPREVTGRVKARVFIASSSSDTDLSVRLCDVYPDGKSYLMAEGILRLRHRNSFEKSEPLTPGRIEEVEVDCWSTSIVFNKGHRIRATVTSSNYPRFDLNPGTGRPWSDAGGKVVQTNRIYCDAGHPSRLILPVVATKLAAAGEN